MQSRGSYRLTIRQGPTPGKVFELGKEVITLGRDISNDVVVNDPEVSRSHFRLTAQAEGYLAEDLGSTNGTFINGQRLTAPRLLHPGDVVGLGETVTLDFGFMTDPGATVIAAAPQPTEGTGAPTAPLPPPRPEPAPAPPPSAAAEIPGGAAARAQFEPVGTPAAPSPAPQRRNDMWRWVGAGCGCLTLCACVTGVTLFALQEPILEFLQSMGF